MAKAFPIWPPAVSQIGNITPWATYKKIERISYYIYNQLIFGMFDWKPIHMAQSEVKWLSIKLTGRITHSSLAFARSLKLPYIQLAAPGQGSFQTKP